MFRLQLKYETLRLFRSPFLWLMLVFLTGSVSFGVYNGAQRIAVQHRTVNEIITRQQEDLTKQKMQADSVVRQLKMVNGWWGDPTNIIVVGGIWRGGWMTALEPSPENLLATGMSDLQPDAWRLTLKDLEPRGNSEFENPVNLSFGSFDLSFVTTFLLPLLVIALTFNLVSAEREQGTLSIQSAQPVSIQQLFLIKTIARFFILSGLTLLITIPALVFGGISLSSIGVWQTGFVAVLYSLFWFLLVLGVNFLGGTSAQNAVASIGLWLLLTLVLPAMVNILAERAFPIPSRAGYQNAMRASEAYIESQRDEKLDEFYQSHPNYERKSTEDKDWKDWYREDFALMEFSQKVRDSIDQIYEYKIDRQSTFTENMMVFSPALSVHRQLTDLAGTSRQAFKASEQALQEAQKNWSDWFLKKFDAGQSLTTADYDEFMKFPTRVTSASLPGSKRGSFWLTVQCLLAGIWAWWIGRRKLSPFR